MQGNLNLSFDPLNHSLFDNHSMSSTLRKLFLHSKLFMPIWASLLTEEESLKQWNILQIKLCEKFHQAQTSLWFPLEMKTVSPPTRADIGKLGIHTFVDVLCGEEHATIA